MSKVISFISILSFLIMVYLAVQIVDTFKDIANVRQTQIENIIGDLK